MQSLHGMLESWLAGDMAPPPVVELVGIKLKGYERGASTMTLTTDRRHFNPMGIVHGGILCDLADAAMGVAVATVLEEGETFVTTDLHTRYFLPIRECDLRAEGKVVRRGGKTATVECEIFDEDDRLIAKASSNCLFQRTPS